MYESSQDPLRLAQSPRPGQAALAPQALEWLFTVAAHNRDFYDDVARIVTEQQFQPNEQPLRYLWRAIVSIITEVGAVTYQNLCIAYDQVVREDPNAVMPPEMRNAIFQNSPFGLLFSIANPPAGSINAANVATARSLLKRFAYERSIVSPLRRFMNQDATDIPTDGAVQGFLASIQTQYGKINTVDELPLADVAPPMDQVREAAAVFVPTGVCYVDNLLNGQRVGDSNGILGPTGGGKTTMAIHMAVTGARQCWMDYNNGLPKKAVVFITMEENAKLVLPRVWSVACEIPRRTLETITDFRTLSTADNLHPYERMLAQPSNIAQGIIQSEQDRFRMASAWLKEHFFLLDLSGSDEFPNAGYGYIPEMASYLTRLRQQHDIGFHSVYLDYAGLAVSRHMAVATGRSDENAYRKMLKEHGDKMRIQIAAKFKTTAWSLHQIKGDKGKSRPTNLLHHTDAAETKDFAENMAVCGCLGTADQRTGCRRFWWSKVRYRPNEEVPPVTLQIDRDFAVMRDVTRNFHANEQTGQFLTEREMNSVAQEGATQQSSMRGPDMPDRPQAPASAIPDPL